VNAAEGYIRLESAPEGLLDIPARELHRLLPQPALLHLDGRRAPPLFVSALLHGNETSGLAVVQALLKKRAGQAWPRAISLFFGNVRAARAGLRRLDDQPDFNRVWPGTEQADCPETRMARAVCEEMAERGAFAGLDLHNNTGPNPLYACVERLDPRTLNLAARFERLAIYSPYPKGTQTGAFADLCPALTLECGQPGDIEGIERAVALIEDCLNLPEIPAHRPRRQDQDLFHALAQVTVREDIRFSYADAAADLLLRADLPLLNFAELPAGAALGRLGRAGARLPLIARDDEGRDIASQFFRVEGDRLVLRKPAMPSMLSPDERVIRQDCLCYLMERISA
jgi:hypothetical protein